MESGFWGKIENLPLDGSRRRIKPGIRCFKAIVRYQPDFDQKVYSGIPLYVEFGLGVTRSFSLPTINTAIEKHHFEDLCFFFVKCSPLSLTFSGNSNYHKYCTTVEKQVFRQSILELWNHYLYVILSVELWNIHRWL